ncbi:MAG: PadR family transcriptional regulator [Trueperaceae bacterium]
MNDVSAPGNNILIMQQRTLPVPAQSTTTKRTRVPSEQQLLLLETFLQSKSPVHGYDLMKATSLGPGTLYGVLKRYFDDGYLKRTTEVVGGRNRIRYELTDRGLHYAKRALVEAEYERGIATTENVS